VHPRWHSPHIALITCAVLAGCFTVWSLLGSGVADAYQVLLKSAVVIQLIPFTYLFLGLMKLDGSAVLTVAGVVGLAATVIGIVAAFLPPADIESVAIFELKMVLGVAAPTVVGWILFHRSQRRDRGAT